MKRYNDNTPVHLQYPVLDLKDSVMPFSAQVNKTIDAKDDNSIAHKPKKQGNKARKADKASYIPVLCKPSKKRSMKRTHHNYSSAITSGVVIGDITPIDAGMSATATLARAERDTCDKHKVKRIR